MDDIPKQLGLVALILFAISLLPSRTITIQRPISSQPTLPKEEKVVPKKVVEATITKYNPVPAQCDSTPDITASGKKVREGIIACPEWLPFGTKVEIKGKTYTCEDRMAERYRHQWRFDILTFDEREAKKWGAKKMRVKIL